MLASLCLSKQLVSNYNVSNAFIETVWSICTYSVRRAVELAMSGSHIYGQHLWPTDPVSFIFEAWKLNSHKKKAKHLTKGEKRPKCIDIIFCKWSWWPSWQVGKKFILFHSCQFAGQGSLVPRRAGRASLVLQIASLLPVMMIDNTQELVKNPNPIKFWTFTKKWMKIQS